MFRKTFCYQKPLIHYIITSVNGTFSQKAICAVKKNHFIHQMFGIFIVDHFYYESIKLRKRNFLFPVKQTYFKLVLFKQKCYIYTFNWLPNQFQTFRVQHSLICLSLNVLLGMYIGLRNRCGEIIIYWARNFSYTLVGT